MMWNRRELKARGRVAFRANYWRCVLAAIILSIVVGGSSGGSATSAASSSSNDGNSMIQITQTTNSYSRTERAIISGVAASVLGIAGGVALALDVFVFNPLEVGGQRFFLVNTATAAEVNEFGFGFKYRYGNVVVTMLLRQIFLLLWTLLFIIPGIIKAYSYRLVPFILAENPDMAPMDAITRSRTLMNGHKWDAFVLDLSFIGWVLLGIVTLGLSLIFYSNPFYYATNAEMYRFLREQEGIA